MKKCIWLVLVPAAVLCGGLLWFALSPGRTSAVRKTAHESPARSRLIAEVLPKGNSSSAHVGEENAEEGGEVVLSDSDRTIEKRMEAALDAEDWEALRRQVDAVLASDNIQLRRDMVCALGWFDEKAAAELTRFLNDPDESLASVAFDFWNRATDLVKDEAFRVAVAESAMKALNDVKKLEAVAAKLKRAKNEGVAVDALVRVLESVPAESAAERVARETYEFVTGEPFSSAEAAEQWKQKRAADAAAEEAEEAAAEEK